VNTVSIAAVNTTRNAMAVIPQLNQAYHHRHSHQGRRRSDSKPAILLTFTTGSTVNPKKRPRDMPHVGRPDPRVEACYAITAAEFALRLAELEKRYPAPEPQGHGVSFEHGK
jgi:hypothetical protein